MVSSYPQTPFQVNTFFPFPLQGGDWLISFWQMVWTERILKTVFIPTGRFSVPLLGQGGDKGVVTSLVFV